MCMKFGKSFFTTIFLLGIFSVAHQASADNILVNPGAETGDMTGWIISSNGGEGWSFDFDNLVQSGTKSFQSSYGLDSMSQTVSLISAGYSAYQLDVEKPTITSTIYTATRGDQAGRYYVTYRLLAADGTTVIASSGDTFGNSGSLISLNASDPWTARTYTFSNYPSGVRYAYIEFGGVDQSSWAGHYGTHFDDASISLPSPSSLGAPAAVMILPIMPMSLDQKELSFSINDGAKTTSSRSVKLLFNADPQYVVRYAVSLDPELSDAGQKDFVKETMFELPDVPGVYTIYVKYFSSTGHSSSVIQKTIEYKKGGVVRETTVSGQKFNRNLKKGSVGADVKMLQEFLNKKGFLVAESGDGSPGKETTNYGPSTVNALKKFQEANFEKILAPQGLTKGTGIFGPTTRAFVNAQ